MVALRLATNDDVKSVKDILHEHHQWFSHIRNTITDKRIEKGMFLYDDDLNGFISFVKYRQKQRLSKQTLAQIGDVFIYQAAIGDKANTTAWQFIRMLKEFRAIHPDVPIWSKVSLDNLSTLAICKRLKMVPVEIVKSRGSIYGGPRQKFQLFRWDDA